MMSASVEIHRRHLLDALQKPISCRDSFNYKTLQYHPLETPVSININRKGYWMGAIAHEEAQVPENEYGHRDMYKARANPAS